MWCYAAEYKLSAPEYSSYNNIYTWRVAYWVYVFVFSLIKIEFHIIITNYEIDYQVMSGAVKIVSAFELFKINKIISDYHYLISQIK